MMPFLLRRYDARAERRYEAKKNGELCSLHT
jgi:hypothetical protein